MKNKVFWFSCFNPDRWSRWVLVLVLFAIPLFGGLETRLTFFQSLSDAYIQVTVFVALTLLIFYGLESWLRIDTGELLEKHKKYQIPIAALLGVLPGCGGAIMVMTQYSIGRLGFGAVVAVLTSTMGDAAFLLIAKEPKTALLVIAVSLTVGILFGYLIERIHGYDFLRQDNQTSRKSLCNIFHFEKIKWPWIALFIPGIVAGVMTAFQVDIDAFFGIEHLYLYLGSVGAIASLFLWFINPFNGPSVTNRFESEGHDFVWDRTIVDTCFVTVWVIIAYLVFELPLLWSGYDLQDLFSGYAVFLPLMGVLLGLLPGCGPQVITTTLYLSGYIPLSAQLGNAISNDGDALFPALAVSPKASLVATIYTAIPAIIVAYGYFWFLRPKQHKISLSKNSLPRASKTSPLRGVFL